MKIRYIGHACFEITAKDGARVVTDPYDPSVGLAMLPLHADMVTMSHEHHDHNHEAMIVGAPQILHGMDEGAAGGIAARAVRSFHDHHRGEKRGENHIRIFSVDGLKIVHMGDQGCTPDADALAAIADADVMMIPVGGFYTVGAQEAKAIADAAGAKCVIPMHFITAHGNYSVIADHRAFLAAMGAEDAQPVEVVEFEAACPPRGVLFMKPQADDLA